jgi:hypothetical protein
MKVQSATGSPKKEGIIKGIYVHMYIKMLRFPVIITQSAQKKEWDYLRATV